MSQGFGNCESEHREGAKTREQRPKQETNKHQGMDHPYISCEICRICSATGWGQPGRELTKDYYTGLFKEAEVASIKKRETYNLTNHKEGDVNPLF